MFSHVVHAPYVNLLKLVEESDVLVRGEAKLTIDRAIGKKVYSVRGKVASESFVQIPADRAHSLGLRGRYVYVQLKPSADKHFTLNLTFTTAGHGSLTLSLSNGFKARKLLGTVLQVPYPEPSARWATLAVDVPRLLKEIFPTAAGDGSGEYVCLRSVHGLPSFSLRSVFSSETLYEPASLPRDVIFPLPRGSAWEQLYAWHALPAVDDAPFIAEFASPPQAKLATGRMGTAPAGALRTPTSGGAVSESPRQPQQAAVPTWSTPTSRPAPSPRPRLESTRVLSGHEPGGREPGRESHGGSLSADRRASLANTSWAAGSPSYAGGAGGDHFATPPSAMGRWAAEGEEAEGASEALTGSRAEGSSLLALGRAIGLNSSAPQTAVWLPERNVVCYAAASLLVLHEIETRHLIGHTARVCALSICGGTQVCA
ncbi:hypothetical protein T492DRAFT_862005 [Pavlovales sp. CCMP2436]|nr:hypothetical protein T492DRAFT_862005 [Pavlovales sp. CCMP2436]